MHEVAALDVADEPGHRSRAGRRSACAARRPCPAPRRSRAGRPWARRRRGARCGVLAAHDGELRRATRVRSRRSRRRRAGAAGAPARHRDRHRDRGPGDAADPAEPQQRAPAIVAPVLPAPTIASARPSRTASRGAHERRVLLRAHRRRRARRPSSMTSARVQRPRPRRAGLAAGQAAARPRPRSPDEQDSTPSCIGRGERAGDDLARRPVAAHRVDRDPRPIAAPLPRPDRSVDARRPGGRGTSRSCRRRCAAASPRRSSGTASGPARSSRQFDARRDAGLGPRGLALGDGHRCPAPGSVVQSSSSRQSVPPGIGAGVIVAVAGDSLRSVPQAGQSPAQSSRTGARAAGRGARRRGRAARGRSRRRRAGRSRPRAGRARTARRPAARRPRDAPAEAAAALRRASRPRTVPRDHDPVRHALEHAGRARRGWSAAMRAADALEPRERARSNVHRTAGGRMREEIGNVMRSVWRGRHVTRRPIPAGTGGAGAPLRMDQATQVDRVPRFWKSLVRVAQQLASWSKNAPRRPRPAAASAGPPVRVVGEVEVAGVAASGPAASGRARSRPGAARGPSAPPASSGRARPRRRRASGRRSPRPRAGAARAAASASSITCWATPAGLPHDLGALHHPLGLHPAGVDDLVGLAAGLARNSSRSFSSQRAWRSSSGRPSIASSSELERARRGSRCTDADSGIERAVSTQLPQLAGAGRLGVGRLVGSLVDRSLPVTSVLLEALGRAASPRAAAPCSRRRRRSGRPPAPGSTTGTSTAGWWR